MRATKAGQMSVQVTADKCRCAKQIEFPPVTA